MIRRQPEVSLGTLGRYRSDPALAIMDNGGVTLPRVHVDQCFTVDDLAPPPPPFDLASLQRRKMFADSLQDTQRPKLRVLRSHAGSTLQRRPTDSVTELSDIVAANSADSGVELKPELFSLLADLSPPVRRRHSIRSSMARQSTATRSKPVNMIDDSMEPCQCEDCRHPLSAGRLQRQRPLPAEPKPANECDYYNDECPYDDCRCLQQVRRMAVTGDGDYQLLQHRSYKAQPPALRRGTVLPPTRAVAQDDDDDDDDVYTMAFSADKPKSTKTRRAPEPPKRSRPDKENKENDDDDGATTYLAKEQSGGLVIVSRGDLEAGLAAGRYVAFDVAPALLLSEAALRTEKEPLKTPLLMTCEDGAAAETLSSHYDSGVSPADSSSAPSPNNTAGAADTTSSAGSPPLLPPRRRPPSGCQFDPSLRELACVSPPAGQLRL